MEPRRPGAPAPHAPSGAHGAGATGATGTTGAHGVAHEAHPSRTRTYIAIFVALIVVTALEVAVTYFPEVPQALALGLMAAVKFFLIASFYMHLRYDSRVFSAFFVIGLIIATGMLVSFLALFTAHYREPYTASQPEVTGTPAAGTPAAGAAGAAATVTTATSGR